MTDAIVKKHGDSVYRVSAGTDVFGQVRKVGAKWHAEYRDTQSGEILRFAGVWGTRASAVEELTPTVERGFF